MSPVEPFRVPLPFDYLATFLWAVSGALLAGRRRYDITGVLTIALVSSTGGGLIRDGIFLQHGPPLLLRTPTYLAIVGGAVALVWAFGKVIRRGRVLDVAVTTADALGLGAYAVVGMQLAGSVGLTPYSMALVGMANAVGGGLLRDVLMRQEPQLFRPGTLNALAALPACIAYLTLTIHARMAPGFSGWCATGLAFAVRVASIRLDLRTRPLRSLAARDSEPPLPPPPGGASGPHTAT